jgi:hypothetical protein
VTIARDWVAEARTILMSGYQEELNRLDVTMDASQVSVNLAFDPKALTQGAVVSIDLEDMYVWQVTSRQLTVERGFNGTTKVAHDAETLVLIKPKFTPSRIFKAINDTLSELSAPDNGLFQVKTEDVPYNPAKGFYDLPGDVLAPLEVYYYDGIMDIHPVRQWDFIRGQESDVAASGQALRIWDGWPGCNLRVLYKARFVRMADLDVDVTTTGLDENAWDIPPLGAAVRLVPPRDVKRTFSESQGESRRDSEVPPGSGRQAASGIAAIYQSRIAQERTALQSMYPYVTA